MVWKDLINNSNKCSDIRISRYTGIPVYESRKAVKIQYRKQTEMLNGCVKNA